eukprot:4596455-Alexandrium_andersonii.AAC.1
MCIRDSILPARLWSSLAMPCPTSVAWLRRLRLARKLPDCGRWMRSVSYTHLRAHETSAHL